MLQRKGNTRLRLASWSPRSPQLTAVSVGPGSDPHPDVKKKRQKKTKHPKYSRRAEIQEKQKQTYWPDTERALAPLLFVWEAAGD